MTKMDLARVTDEILAYTLGKTLFPHALHRLGFTDALDPMYFVMGGNLFAGYDNTADSTFARPPTTLECD